MDERLKRLRQSMKKNTFPELKFTEQHKKRVQKEISMQMENEDYLYLSVMQLLLQEKNGFELMANLRSRGIKKLEENEGLLYSLLHRLELTGCLDSRWEGTTTKFYRLSDKGKKIMKKAEKKYAVKQPYLKEILGM